eukprot:4210705-Amphidinium_carterae.1
MRKDGAKLFQLLSQKDETVRILKTKLCFNCLRVDPGLEKSLRVDPKLQSLFGEFHEVACGSCVRDAYQTNDECKNCGEASAWPLVIFCAAAIGVTAVAAVLINRDQATSAC